MQVLVGWVSRWRVLCWRGVVGRIYRAIGRVDQVDVAARNAVIIEEELRQVAIAKVAVVAAVTTG